MITKNNVLGALVNGGRLARRAYELAKPVVANVCERAVEGVEDVREKFSEEPTDATVEDLLSYYQSEGLVGEEELATLQTLCLIHGKCFGIYAASGSGKSFVVEKLFKLVPERWVYRMELGSKTAVYYDEDAVNRARVIYIPELQKAMQTNNSLVTEMLKSVSEGRDSVRRVTTKGKVDTYRIQAGKGIVFTLAKENTFKYDAELARRFLVFETDESEEQTEKILSRKPLLRNRRNGKGYGRLRKHIANCMQQNFQFNNPYLEEVVEEIPRTMLARTYTDHLFDLFEASARFNYRRRNVVDNVVEVDVEDIELVCGCYWNTFIETLGADPGEFTSSFSHHARLTEPTSYNP